MCFIGKRYYQIIPGPTDLADDDQSRPDRGITRADWAPQHQTTQYSARPANIPSRRQPRVGTTDDENTDAYATFSESEGPWSSQPHYEPGTALGDPDLAQHFQQRQSCDDSAMGMPRKSSVTTVDSRFADGELTDMEAHQRATHATSANHHTAATRKSTYRPNYTTKSRTSISSGHTQVLCEGGRPVSHILPHRNVRRTSEQSPDRFQATLNSFPNTPSNVPTRNSSIKTYAPTQEVKSVASALQARAGRARARKLRDLKQVCKPSIGSESSLSAADARTSIEAVSGAAEREFVQNQTRQKQKDKTSATSSEMCSHGFKVCPHGCKHGHHEAHPSEVLQHLHPTEIAYRAALPLPPPPGQQLSLIHI